MELVVNNHTFENDKIDIIDYICMSRSNEQVVNDTLIHLESGALQEFLLDLFYFEIDVLSKLNDISFSDTIENIVEHLVVALREIKKKNDDQWAIYKEKYTDDYDIEINMWGFSRV